MRVVIDTNVVLSAILFGGRTPGAIRHAWQSGTIQPVVSRHTAQELMVALGYPKFRLSDDEQHEMLATYLPFCETLAKPRTRIALPTCRDIDDQPFLVLAAAAHAEALVTGDRDLLELQGSVPFAIMRPAALLAQL